MYDRQTKMLVKHYLEQIVSKAELGQQFLLSWRTLLYWIAFRELDRHLDIGAVIYARHRVMGNTLGSENGIVVVLFTAFSLGIQPQ